MTFTNDKQSADDACRYCMEACADEALLSPCACRGSMRLLHQRCGLSAYEVRALASGDWLTMSCPICRTDYVGDLGNAVVAMAWRANEELLGRDRRQSARALAIFANAYGDIGDAAWKRNLLERALAIQEREYGPEHCNVSITVTNLGNAYGAL